MGNEDFYDMLNEVLGSHICEDCGSRQWVGYTDGHVWYECLDCDEPGKLRKLERGFLDIAGYVTRYPPPDRPVPPNIEFRDKPRFPHEEFHEARFYRLR